jgi:hypothetical protein
MNQLQKKAFIMQGIDVADLVSTGELNRILGVQLTSDFIERLGIVPILRTHVGVYWKTDDIDSVLLGLAKYFINKLGCEK